MGAREKELLCEVIDRAFPNDGEYTTRFEKKIAEICDVPHCVAVTSGTMAIAAALLANGIKHGDEVIVPDITFIATANAAHMAGATPVLADVRPEDFMIDPLAVERAITPRTRAIVPVHISGRPAPMTELRAIAEKHGLVIVEDAAEALGSRSNNQQLGTFGSAGCFSFSPAKTITTGQGGAIITTDPKVDEQLRLFKDQGRPVRGTGGADLHVALGYNFKFTNLQAAMGIAQLENFEARVEHQRHLYNWYCQYLPQNERIHMLPFDLAGGAVPQWIDVWVDERDELHDTLVGQGIQPRKFWFPLHTQVPYQHRDDEFPNAAQVGRHAMWMPSALTMREEDVERVCHAVQEWLDKA